MRCIVRNVAPIFVAILVLALAQGAGAATVRTEAEAIPHLGGCWGQQSWAAFSGGQARFCAWSQNAPLTWSVTVPSGSTGTVTLYGYRDAVRRGFRIRVDDGAWTSGYTQGPFAASVPFHTTVPLTAGTHEIELEWIDLEGAFSFDYAELETNPVAGTPAPPPPPPPPPPADTPTDPHVCRIAPADGQAAIAAAIRSCRDGSTVEFPQGATYTQSGPIVVDGRSDLTIDGNGSTFRSTAHNDNERRDQWRIHKGRRVTLKNATIVGNFTSNGRRRIIPGNQYNAGVLVSGGHTVTLRDLTVRDTYGDFVTTAPSGLIDWGNVLAGEVPTNIRIERLKGMHAARMCVAVTASDGTWVQSSTLEDCGIAGIDLEIDVPGERLHGVHVLYNTISGYNFGAVTVPQFGNAGDVRDIEIRGNNILTPPDSCAPTIDIKDERWGAHGGGQTAQNIVVEENALKALYQGVSYHDTLSGSVRNNRVELAANPKHLCGPDPRPVVTERSPNVQAGGNTALGF